ncbi:MAG: diguanylate cyclase [Lachnospiraceae bacterium]|nr:diguanylate cyclase [Lachnospiraceae bacterium]
MIGNVKKIGYKILLIIGIVEIVSILILFLAANYSVTNMSDIWDAEQIPIALRTSRISLAIVCIIVAVIMIVLTAVIISYILSSVNKMNKQINSLESRDEIYQQMIEAQTVGTLVTNAKTAEIVMVNKKALDYFEIEKDRSSLNVMDFRCKFDEEGDKAFVSQLMELRNGKGEVEFEQAVYLNDETCMHMLVNAKKISLSGDESVIIYSFMDITDRKKLEDELQVQSETDFLTGISNRRSGEFAIEKIVSDGGHGMFCLFDVDKFKSVNDNFGHAVGDNVLIAIAKTMKKTFRSSDVLVRLGGDEFVVFATGIEGRDIADMLVNRFISNIESMEVEGLEGHEVCISLGALLVNDDISFADMYSKADSLMYDCKAKQGNIFAFYGG